MTRISRALLAGAAVLAICGLAAPPVYTLSQTTPLGGGPRWD